MEPVLPPAPSASSRTGFEHQVERRLGPADALRRLGLTEREAEVLGLLAEARTNRQIGDALFISEKTASVHVTNLLRKLGVGSGAEAAEMSRRLG
jgi:DNA-binding NarL/FixJ family response regulator